MVTKKLDAFGKKMDFGPKNCIFGQKFCYATPMKPPFFWLRRTRLNGIISPPQFREGFIWLDENWCKWELKSTKSQISEDGDGCKCANLKTRSQSAASWNMFQISPSKSNILNSEEGKCQWQYPKNTPCNSYLICRKNTFAPCLTFKVKHILNFLLVRVSKTFLRNPSGRT